MWGTNSSASDMIVDGELKDVEPEVDSEADTQQIVVSHNEPEVDSEADTQQIVVNR